MTALSRPLSPVERFHWIADQVSPLTVIARVRVCGALPISLLRQALDALAQRHAFLRVAIAAESDSTPPRFVPTSAPIPLRHERFESGDDPVRWVREVNDRELPARIDSQTGPLLRAVVLTHANGAGTPESETNDLILAISHCIADGMTGISLLRQWIELAHALLLEKPVHPPASAQSLPPPPEEILPWQHRGLVAKVRSTALAMGERYARKKPRPRRFVPTCQVPFEQRRTRMLHRSLSSGQLDMLVDACRRERTTVHGALTAALIGAVARDAIGTAPGRFSIGSPMDFRGELAPPVSPDTVGSYAATVPSIVDWRPDVPFWSMARAVHRSVRLGKWAGAHLAAIPFLAKMGPKSMVDSRPFVESMEAFGPINLCMSNLGRQDFPDAIGPWRISGAQLGASLSANGYLVAVVNTSHDHLYWNFMYVTEAVPEARVLRIADDCIETVLSATARTVDVPVPA